MMAGINLGIKESGIKPGIIGIKIPVIPVLPQKTGRNQGVGIRVGIKVGIMIPTPIPVGRALPAAFLP